MKKVISLFLVILIMFIGFGSIQLNKTETITSSYKLSKEIKTKIDLETKNLTEIQIVNYCINQTCNLLSFSRSQNCCSYARMCTEMCNYGLQKNSYDSRVNHIRGYVSFYGINLCKLATYVFPKEKNFLKDHDFIELQLSDKNIFYDPCLYDIIKLKCTTINN